MSRRGPHPPHSGDRPHVRRDTWISNAALTALPCCLLIVMVVSAWSLLHIRPTGTVKLVVVHAFSGPLHDQGYDALTAVRAATNTLSGQRGLLNGRRLEVEALDDEGSATRAIAQLDAAAVDTHVLAAICCSSEETSASTATQLASHPASTFPIRFPALLSPQEASGAVASLVRQLHPSRPVLIRMGADAGDAFAAAVLAQTTPVVVNAEPETGLSLDDVAAKAVGSRPDLVILDVPSPIAALLIPRLRTIGFNGPVTGRDELASSEMVTWTGAALGDMLVPTWPQPENSIALERAFASERGHAPSQIDRLFYAATIELLSSHGPAQQRDAATTRGPWAVSELIPGQFPPRLVPAP